MPFERPTFKDKKNKSPEGQHPRLEEVRVATLATELANYAREVSEDPSQLTEEELQGMLEKMIKEKYPQMERNPKRENKVIQEALRRLKAEKQYK
jgi:predicted alpha/beta-fold hydrolase